MKHQSKTLTLITAALLSSAMMVGGAQAADSFLPDEAGASTDYWSGTTWLIRGRVIGVIPDEGDATLGGGPIPLAVDDAIVPELDITYFFNDNFAAELILGVAPHTASLPAGDVTDLLLLPPTLTLQYHMPMGAFKPYVGAGINYTAVIDSDPTALIGGVDDWDSSFGFALQAGFDYAIDERWSVNVDVKKLWLNLEGTATAGAVPVSVDIDPWIVGAGIGYRF